MVLDLLLRRPPILRRYSGGEQYYAVLGLVGLNGFFVLPEFSLSRPAEQARCDDRQGRSQRANGSNGAQNLDRYIRVDTAWITIASPRPWMAWGARARPPL